MDAALKGFFPSLFATKGNSAYVQTATNDHASIASSPPTASEKPLTEIIKKLTYAAYTSRCASKAAELGDTILDRFTELNHHSIEEAARDALPHFERAIELGCYNTAFRLGIWFSEGRRGFEKNIEKGGHYFDQGLAGYTGECKEKAAQIGDTILNRFEELKYPSIEEAAKDALPHFERAIESGCDDTAFLLGIWFSEGHHGFEKNIEKSDHYFELGLTLAASKNITDYNIEVISSGNFAYTFGMVYLNGTHNVQKNFSKAMQLLKSADELGSPRAPYQLGLMDLAEAQAVEQEKEDYVGNNMVLATLDSQIKEHTDAAIAYFKKAESRGLFLASAQLRAINNT